MLRCTRALSTDDDSGGRSGPKFDDRDDRRLRARPSATRHGLGPAVAQQQQPDDAADGPRNGGRSRREDVPGGRAELGPATEPDAEADADDGGGAGGAAASLAAIADSTAGPNVLASFQMPTTLRTLSCAASVVTPSKRRQRGGACAQPRSAGRGDTDSVLRQAVEDAIIDDALDADFELLDHRRRRAVARLGRRALLLDDVAAFARERVDRVEAAELVRCRGRLVRAEDVTAKSGQATGASRSARDDASILLVGSEMLA